MESQKNVLFDFVTVIYFLLSVLFKIFMGLKVRSTVRLIEISEKTFCKKSIGTNEPIDPP